MFGSNEEELNFNFLFRLMIVHNEEKNNPKTSLKMSQKCYYVDIIVVDASLKNNPVQMYRRHPQH